MTVTGEVGILAFASYNGAGIRIRPNQKSAILPSKGINLNFWFKRTTQDTGPWVVLHNRLFAKAVVLFLSDPTRVLTERYTQNGGGTAVRTSTLWITTRLARNQTTHPTGFPQPLCVVPSSVWSVLVPLQMQRAVPTPPFGAGTPECTSTHFPLFGIRYIGNTSSLHLWSLPQVPRQPITGGLFSLKVLTAQASARILMLANDGTLDVGGKKERRGNLNQVQTCDGPSR